jgi:hypothetical protein
MTLAERATEQLAIEARKVAAANKGRIPLIPVR